jgi:very-short-patch-repair endonuclease
MRCPFAGFPAQQGRHEQGDKMSEEHSACAIDPAQLSKITQSRDKWADEKRRDLLDDWDFDFYSLCQICESPIEKILGAYFLRMAAGDQEVKFQIGRRQIPEGFCGILGTAQYTFGDFRADFAFLCIYREFRKMVIVECDGHEFHDRTKEPAQHDRQRDRWFVAHGAMVLRFTGAEIWRDASACADEVAEILSNTFDDLRGLDAALAKPAIDKTEPAGS